MRDNRRVFTFIFIAFLSILIIGLFVYFYTESIRKPHPITHANDTTSPASDTLPTSSPDDASGKVASASTKDLIIPKDLTIPILMYHHIRDYNDPNDAIGTNLSVGVVDFQKQLDYIKAQGYTPITFKDITSGKLPPKPIILTFDDGYENFYKNALPAMKHRNMIGVTYLIVDSLNKPEYMNDQQIIEIKDYGIELGAHTLSHPDLSTVPEERATKEIGESKAKIETTYQTHVISFCYPSGRFTADTEDVVNGFGYQFAVTTQSGIATFNDTFALKRYRVNHDTDIARYLE